MLNGYNEPYRLDRNKHGGGVLVYVREGIPSKPLKKHTFTRDIEGIFIEINLRKTKILILMEMTVITLKFHMRTHYVTRTVLLITVLLPILNISEALTSHSTRHVSRLNMRRLCN